MRTLLVESSPGCGSAVAASLDAAGHDVMRCHEPGGPAFPCAGLRDACPMDQAEGIDVAVVVRTADEVTSAADEAGVTCALRRGVPVVMMGDDATDPYAGWVYEAPPGIDAAVACSHAVEVDSMRRAKPLRVELRRLLELHGSEVVGADVLVQRDGRRIRITATVPCSSPIDRDETIAAKLLAVDDLGVWPGSIVDVSVVHRDR